VVGTDEEFTHFFEFLGRVEFYVVVCKQMDKFVEGDFLSAMFLHHFL
jgi:hypothetical protein